MLKKLLIKRNIIILVVLLCGIGLFLKFRPSTAIETKSQKPSLAKLNAKVETTTEVKKGDVIQTLTLAGKIQAEKYAVLKFQTSGRLAWVGVKKGDTVKKYQALASLDQTELKKKLQSEMNDYLTDRSTFEDTQALYKETKDRLLLTDEIKRILDRKQYSLNNAVLAVELSDLTRRYSTLTTPIAGLVVDIDEPNSGVNITPATATFTVVDPKSLYFRCEVAEDDIAKITLNSIADIRLDSYADELVESKASYISFTAVAGQTNTVYEVKFPLTVDNSSLKYRLGMNGDAKIRLNSKTNVLYVPAESVFRENKEAYVYLYQGSTKVKTKVEVGIESDDSAEIISGLKEGDSVVVPTN